MSWGGMYSVHRESSAIIIIRRFMFNFETRNLYKVYSSTSSWKFKHFTAYKRNHQLVAKFPHDDDIAASLRWPTMAEVIQGRQPLPRFGHPPLYADICSSIYWPHYTFRSVINVPWQPCQRLISNNRSPARRAWLIWRPRSISTTTRYIYIYKQYGTSSALQCCRLLGII